LIPGSKVSSGKPIVTLIKNFEIFMTMSDGKKIVFVLCIGTKSASGRKSTELIYFYMLYVFLLIIEPELFKFKQFKNINGH
jgi:hypothetical protein